MTGTSRHTISRATKRLRSATALRPVRPFLPGLRSVVTAAPLAIVFCTAMTASAEAKRLALVVGNSAYDHVYSLNNATNDANDVAKSLERLDFEVTLLTDINGADFDAKLEAFAQRADDDDVESTLFFFSGHAFQLDGKNYLVPKDAALTSREAIENQTWRLDEIVEKLQDRNRQTLIFLDACRNNPLPESSQIRANQGLAKLETGTGTYVAYATQPGNVTLDGAGDNSPFTLALLDHMETPGISISDMMIRVRNDVRAETFEKQVPFEQNSLFAQFYFEPEVERSAELTDADYEMIAALDPETRKRLLAALGNTGVQLEIEIVEDEPEVELASIDPSQLPTTGTSILIDDPDEDDIAQTTTPTEPQATSAVKVQLPKVSTSTGSTQVARAQPTVSVAQPKESTALVPREAGTAEQTEVALQTTTGETNAEVAATSGDATQATVSTDGQTLASVLPADPTQSSRRLVDENALILAALSPTRSLGPTSVPRPRVIGQEVEADSEEAAAAGIDLKFQQLEGKELAKEAQRELRRLGCYRMAIDGDWGKGSRLALVRYYATKKTAADTLEPSTALLQVLKSEEKVICARVVEKKKQPKKAVKTKKTVKKKTTTAKKATKKKKKTAKKQIKRVKTKKTAKGGTKKKTIKRINSGVFR